MAAAAASAQERFEARRSGRLAISVFLLVTLAAAVVANLPGSRVRDEAMQLAGPYLIATGTDQDWRVFAPEPRRSSIDLLARVRYADGREAVWRPPSGDDLTGSSWDYRWRKWMEHAIQDARATTLWRPAAAHVLGEMRRPAVAATSVTLVRRWRDLPPPGAVDPEPGWKSYDFFRLELGGGRAR